MSEAQRRIHGTCLLRRRCHAAHLLQAEQSSPAPALRTRRQKSMTWSTGAHRFERLSTRCIMFSRKRDQWRCRKGSVTGCRDRQSLKVSHHTVASPRGHADDCVRSSTPSRPRYGACISQQLSASTSEPRRHQASDKPILRTLQPFRTYGRSSVPGPPPYLTLDL